MSPDVQAGSCRRLALLAAALLSAAAALTAPLAQAAPACPAPWPAWQDFREHWMSDGGRIVDHGDARLHTVSEAQAYSMLFALAANDRASFDRLLDWTQDNLAQGDLTAHLPAWLWGKRDDEQWGVLDPNSASDADLWMSWSLLEAGRLWSSPRYTALGRLLASRIQREETADLPGLGPTLLPAPHGYTPTADSWRLNPSYAPLQLMRRLAAEPNGGTWQALADSNVKLVLGSAPHGYAPDWVLYQRNGGFSADPDTQGVGSYDAIRDYLWAALLAADEPQRDKLVNALRPMAAAVAHDGVPPARVDTAAGTYAGSGPAAFSAALIPFLQVSGFADASRDQALRLQAIDPQRGQGYYDRVLGLFASGWQDGWLRFDRDGHLQTRWNPACVAASRR